MHHLVIPKRIFCLDLIVMILRKYYLELYLPPPIPVTPPGLWYLLDKGNPNQSTFYLWLESCLGGYRPKILPIYPISSHIPWIVRNSRFNSFPSKRLHGNSEVQEFRGRSGHLNGHPGAQRSQHLERMDGCCVQWRLETLILVYSYRW